jgi:hypothetical protein
MPFAIRLLFGSSGYKQQVAEGMDTGTKVIGCAAVANRQVVYQSEIQIRQDISGKMEQRRMYRRSRRGRKLRYRQAFFALTDIFDNTVTASVNVKTACRRLTARTGTLIQEVAIHPLP